MIQPAKHSTGRTTKFANFLIGCVIFDKTYINLVISNTESEKEIVTENSMFIINQLVKIACHSSVFSTSLLPSRLLALLKYIFLYLIIYVNSCYKVYFIIEIRYVMVNKNENWEMCPLWRITSENNMSVATITHQYEHAITSHRPETFHKWIPIRNRHHAKRNCVQILLCNFWM